MDTLPALLTEIAALSPEAFDDDGGELSTLHSAVKAWHKAGFPGLTGPVLPAEYTGPCHIEVRADHRSGRGRYRRAEGKGYTDDIAKAGVFTVEIARLNCEGSHGENYPIAIESANPTPAPRTGTVADKPDAELVEYTVRNAGRLLPRNPRWHHVAEAIGLGSTYAAQLCRRFGLDPEEEVGTEQETEEEEEPTPATVEAAGLTNCDNCANDEQDDDMGVRNCALLWGAGRGDVHDWAGDNCNGDGVPYKGCTGCPGWTAKVPS
jgi:hypothetical protein